MSKRETHKRPEAQLSEGDRMMIANARDILKRYGEEYNIDTAEPLTELGYEQRMARGRALELTVQLCTARVVPNNANVTQWANKLYEFIWNGEVEG